MPPQWRGTLRLYPDNNGQDVTFARQFPHECGIRGNFNPQRSAKFRTCAETILVLSPVRSLCVREPRGRCGDCGDGKQRNSSRQLTNG